MAGFGFAGLRVLALFRDRPKVRLSVVAIPSPVVGVGLRIAPDGLEHVSVSELGKSVHRGERLRIRLVCFAGVRRLLRGGGKNQSSFPRDSKPNQSNAL